MATKVDTKEIQALREKVARLKEDKARLEAGFNNNIQAELSKIKQRGKKTADKVTLKENNDHKNISLWVRKGVNYGKRIGPLHPDNAEKTLLKFMELGRPLSVDQPTQQEIDEYRKSEEYLQDAAEVARKRSYKDKSKKPDQLDKLTAQIEKLTGMAANSIVQQHQVKEGMTGAKIPS